MPIPVNPNRGELDFNQIFQRVFDELNDRLRVDAIINTSIGDVEVQLSHLDDSVRLGDGTGYLTTTVVGPSRALDVNVVSPISTVIDNPEKYSIINLSMGLANTEYSFSIPDTARRVEIRERESKGPIRLYKSSGGSLYYTISRGSIYKTDEISPNSLTFYVQSAQAVCTLEVIYWEL